MGNMKPGTKSFLKTSAVLALFFFGYCLAIVIFQSRFAPNEGVDTFAELKAQGVPMTKAIRIANPADHVCVFGDIDSVMWTIPSGPPAYLFDGSGALVDYTLDVGDSTKFQKEYEVYSGKSISIDQVESEFAANP